jgi:transmembrane sensor
MEPLNELERLGGSVAREQDRALDGIDLSAVRARLRRAPAVIARTRNKVGWAVGLVLAGACVAGAVMAVAWVFPRGQLQFRVAGGKVAIDKGAWMSAPSDRALPVEFSDGSRFVLSAGTRGRVVRTAKTGAELLVERGRADLSIVPRRDNDWRVDLGPFVVRVTGTRFSADWNPDLERLVVVLHEGTVTVTGCGLDGETRLHAGQVLKASCSEAKVEISSDPGPSGAEGNAGPPSTPEGAEPSGRAEAELGGGVSAERAEADPGPAPSGAARAPGRRPRQEEGTSWRALASEGHYREALAAAEALGFEAECMRASAVDLLALGTAARFAQSPLLANQAYLALRQRFKTDPRASLAAFNLARVAFDQAGDYAQAASWFETYLREQPAGPLAEEASGRLLEARERAGDRAGAKRMAERYLVRYPRGAHADFAKRLLE